MRELQIKDIALGSGRPKICVSIAEVTQEAILQKARLIQNHEVDLVEWRADAFEHVMDYSSVKMTLEALKQILAEKPLIFTVRTRQEGGLLGIEDRSYAKLLCEIIELKAVEIVDLEVRLEKGLRDGVIDAAQAHDCLVIGSKHDFSQTDDIQTLLETFSQMESMGVAIVKVACMPNSEADVLRLMLATQIHYEKAGRVPLVTMSMGQLGKISRVAGAYFGSSMTFGAIGEVSAPGQIHVDTLKKALDTLALTAF